MKMFSFLKHETCKKYDVVYWPSIVVSELYFSWVFLIFVNANLNQL